MASKDKKRFMKQGVDDLKKLQEKVAQLQEALENQQRLNDIYHFALEHEQQINTDYRKTIIDKEKELKETKQELTEKNELIQDYDDALWSKNARMEIAEEHLRETLLENDALHVEKNILQEAFDSIGGQEAVNEKIAKEKEEKEKQREVNAPTKKEQRKKQKQHDELAKTSAAILKEEYKYEELGHKVDRTASIEERKEMVNEAVEKDKMYAKMFDSIERKEKWEKRVEPIKKIAKTIKDVTVAVAKTTDELAIQPVADKAVEKGKEFNREVAVPAAISVGIMKEAIGQDLSRTATKAKEFWQKAKTNISSANKNLKAKVIKLTMIDKSQATPEDKWGVVAARASLSANQNIGSKLQVKFGSISDKLKNSLGKVKDTFNKHLENSKNSVEKTNEAENTKEETGPEL